MQQKKFARLSTVNEVAVRLEAVRVRDGGLVITYEPAGRGRSATNSTNRGCRPFGAPRTRAAQRGDSRGVPDATPGRDVLGRGDVVVVVSHEPLWMRVSIEEQGGNGRDWTKASAKAMTSGASGTRPTVQPPMPVSPSAYEGALGR